MTVYEELQLAYSKEIRNLLKQLIEIVSQEGRQIDRLSEAHIEMLAEIEASANFRDEAPESTVD